MGVLFRLIREERTYLDLGWSVAEQVIRQLLFSTDEGQDLSGQRSHLCRSQLHGDVLGLKRFCFERE